jgi:hypothetical protein
VHKARRGRRCLRCPFCAASGQCLNPVLKSGRCGDWVWYMLGSKQFRRLWVKPRDPRTPSQRQWRARLSAASRSYSQSLTDEQQNACIAAGAKRRSWPRLGQWGRLTGQQFWVGRECEGKADGRRQSTLRSAATEGGNAETRAKGLQTKRISLPTWDTHRSRSVVPPGQHRSGMGRARNYAGRRMNEECRRHRVEATSEARRDRAVAWYRVRSPPSSAWRLPFRVSAPGQQPERWRPGAREAPKRKSPTVLPPACYRRALQ